MQQISPPELSYISSSLASSSKRVDGRPLLAFRDLHLSTSVIVQANGSSRVACGGTDVLVGLKLETGADGDAPERLAISVDVSQSALQSLPADPTAALTAHAAALTQPLLAHPQLVILPGAKSWLLAVHVTVLASGGGGNLHDVLGVAIKSALWDMRIPHTRAVQHVRPAHLQDHQGQSGALGAAGDAEAGGVEMEDGAQDTGMKALLKGKKRAPQRGQGGADFELLDFEADAGAPLQGREDLPISITLNLTPRTLLPFLDATLFESFCVPTRLIAIIDGQGNVRSLQQEVPAGSAAADLAGEQSGAEGVNNEIPLSRLDALVDVAADLAEKLSKAVNARLKDPLTSKGGVRLGAYP